MITKVICPECESSDVDVEENYQEAVCNSCGLVFNPSERNHKTDGYLDVVDRDFPAKQGIDIERNFLTRSIRPANATEHRVLRALLRIEEFSQQLQLPKQVKVRAAEIYREAMHRGLVWGRSINVFAAASIYLGCRLIGCLITLDLIAKVARESKRRINSAVRLLIKELGINPRQKEWSDIINAVGYRMELDEHTLKKAEEIIHLATKKLNVAGKMKEGFAAAAIYIAAKAQGIRLSQREIANACGITEVTLRTRKRDLLRFVH